MKNTFFKKKKPPVLWAEAWFAVGSVIDYNYCDTSESHEQQGSKRLPKEQPFPLYCSGLAAISPLRYRDLSHSDCWKMDI